MPDVSGPGAVLRAGNLHMKVTNFGHVGNIFQNLSSDPAGQWVGDSGVEYLNSIRLAVGAKDPSTLDPARVHRVSYLLNWRPPSLDPEDRIYSAADTTVNGARFVNDDGDVDPITGAQRVDEDFLDGRDNDGDGLIDEDFGALGQQMYSCVMRDDTPQAMAADTAYRPLGLECRQLAWAYAVPGFRDFDAVEYTIYNRSGHTLDSIYVGWAVDLDCGPVSHPNYYADDLDLPGFPSGEFTLAPAGDPRRQLPHAPNLEPPVPSDVALCPGIKVRLNGFATSDDDGDGGLTPGIGALLLVNHTVDPLAQDAPSRVGFRAFRSFTAGTSYDHGGNPGTPAQRYEFMSSTQNIDPTSGFISVAPGSFPADYIQWCSIGPFLHLPADGSIQATIAFAVQNGNHAIGLQYPGDYQSYRNGSLSVSDLFDKYPLLKTAYACQVGFEGVHEPNSAYPAPSFHGRETPVRLEQGQPPTYLADCHDQAAGSPRLVTDATTTWFDFDCDYCTGVWNYGTQTGLFHRTWAVPPTLLVDVDPAPPREARVLPASPNPARDGARLELDLPAATLVRVAVYDLAGRRIRELSRGLLPAGRRVLVWDLRNDAGARVGPGLYYYRVSLGARQETGRLVVVQ